MSRCTKKNCPMVGVSADCDLKDCPYRTEADQSKDTIYREDAIKAEVPDRVQIIRKEIERLCENCERPTEEEMKERALESMVFGFSVGLTAGRPQEWIPCSLRSPEKSGEYLVTIGVEQRRIAIGYYSTKYRRWYAAGDAFAWMPLPDPWKGEND